MFRNVWVLVVSLVPERYRKKSLLEGSGALVQAATFSGLCQVTVFSFFFIATFISKAPSYFEPASSAVLNSQQGPEMNLMGVRLTTGVLGLAGFLFQPLHLFYAYMAIEGGVRAFFAFSFGEILSTLPLVLVSSIHNLLEVGKRRRLRALARDEIQPARDDTYDLHVLSSRSKRDWNRNIGIRFRNELYILAGEQSEEGPRPFGYLLRKIPADDIVVVTCNYDPNPGLEASVPNLLVVEVLFGDAVTQNGIDPRKRRRAELCLQQKCPFVKPGATRRHVFFSVNWGLGSVPSSFSNDVNRLHLLGVFTVSVDIPCGVPS